MNVVQRYIACEGRFTNIFRYYLSFLLHLNGESRLKLPYYPFKSIEKMVTQVRNQPDHSSRSVFHHSLIKLLITTKLETIHIYWQHFIFWSGFEPEAQMHDDEEIRRQYKRKKIKVVEVGNEQAQKVFDVANMSMSNISKTEVQRKSIIEFQKEEVTAPDTPRDIGENFMVQEFSSNSKQDDAPITNNIEKKWR